MWLRLRREIARAQVIMILRIRLSRIRLARFLVAVSFVWPFLNAGNLLGATFETNFILVFVAAALMPEILLKDGVTFLLATVVILIAAVLAPNGTGYLRLTIGLLPIIFIVNLHRQCVKEHEVLISYKVAYRALLLFLAVCVVQYIHFSIVPVIPQFATDSLTRLVPRYMEEPYDDSGIRGVQGWASEPSSAAMTCFAFSVVAIQQKPQGRLRILVLFTLLTLVNRSIYSVVLLGLLAFAQLFSMKRPRSMVLFAIVMVGVGLLLLSASGRAVAVRESVAAYGLDETANVEMLRFGQIIYPILAFPRLYAPVTLFDTFLIEPLGLLPLLVGYGSVLGCLLYWRLMFQVRRIRNVASWPLALGGIVVLSFLASPNFVPAIVAFVYAMAPTSAQAGDQLGSAEVVRAT